MDAATVIKLIGPEYKDDDLLSRSHLNGITDLIVYDTGVTDAGFRCAAHITSLCNVEIASSLITDVGIQAFVGLKNIRSFAIHSAPQVSDHWVGEICRLPQLGSLQLCETAVSDRGIREIVNARQLTTLVLDGTQIADAGVPLLGQLRELDSISLCRTSVSGCGFEGFFERPLDVYLDSTAVNDTGVDLMVRNLPFLRRVSLSNCEISDVACMTLARLKSIELVRINNTRISDDGLLAFAGHPSLDTVEVEGCTVSKNAVRRVKASRPRAIHVYA